MRSPQTVVGRDCGEREIPGGQPDKPVQNQRQTYLAVGRAVRKSRKMPMFLPASPRNLPLSLPIHRGFLMAHFDSALRRFDRFEVLIPSCVPVSIRAACEGPDLPDFLTENQLIRNWRTALLSAQEPVLAKLGPRKRGEHRSLVVDSNAYRLWSKSNPTGSRRKEVGRRRSTPERNTRRSSSGGTRWHPSQWSAQLD